jgi:hypothetical protein
MGVLGIAVGKRSRTAWHASEEEAVALDLIGGEPCEVRVDLDPAPGLPDPSALRALGCTLADIRCDLPLSTLYRGVLPPPAPGSGPERHEDA